VVTVLRVVEDDGTITDYPLNAPTDASLAASSTRSSTGSSTLAALQQHGFRLPVQPRVCARCGRPVRRGQRVEPPPRPGAAYPLVVARRWPEGPVCTGCFVRACETYGRCACCGIDRLLPGRDATGQGLCTDCAGLGDFTCTRCAQEGLRPYAGGVCGRCVLRDRLAVLLDRGDGTIRAELVPFYDAICAMSRPRSGLLWLSKKHVPPILTALADERFPLTHASLSTLSPARSVTYVRDLFVAHGILPPADRFLLMFEKWLPGWLATIPDPDHAKILERYATWDVLRRLRRTAQSEPIGPYRNQNARYHLRVAAAFLDHLHRHGTTLADCSQANLDRWATTATTADRETLRLFLRWARVSKLVPPLILSTKPQLPQAPVPGREQLRTLRRILTDTRIPCDDRVIAMFIALYAQPLSRIVWLTISDVIHADAGHSTSAHPAINTAVDTAVFVRLGDPPAPVPPPLDQLLLEHVATRTNQTTATNPSSHLLFPGRRAGQPIHPTTARLRLHALGIPNLLNRRSALHQILRTTPAPVVAGMLGYNPGNTERIAADSGITWARYVHAPRPAQR
jgi:hypothetical protein